MTATLHEGDCLAILPTLAENSIDACVCDPPYHLTSIVKRFGKPNSAPAQEGTDGRFARASRGFMGKEWDGGDVAMRPETWKAVLRVLKPGAHLFAFGGTRTFHRVAVGIEDAGFELRDTINWLYGTGFPKSHDAGEGRGTALKPAWEPIIMARKPLSESSVAANLAKWGTGAINIDECRIETAEDLNGGTYSDNATPRAELWGAPAGNGFRRGAAGEFVQPKGRWPANVITDGSDEVVAAFPESDGQQGDLNATGRERPTKTCFGDMAAPLAHPARNDSGSAARFFYTAKADADDRWGSKHPTVKPVDLIRYLARLITPPRGTILDPFAGSGTLAVAALAEGFDATLIEREAEYCADIRERLAFYAGEGRHSMVSKNRARQPTAADPDEPQFL